MEKPEILKTRKIDRVITERGSVYTYLPDGTTQRYKTVEGKKHPPKTAIVFIPDLKTIRKIAPPNFDVDSILGKNETQYEQTLLNGVYGEDRHNYIVNAHGEKLNTNQAIEQEPGEIFLTFMKGDTLDFFIPVGKRPTVGYYAFETGKNYDPQAGEWIRRTHLGHKVTEIIYK